ncbi:MAG: MaoC family dehydratase [Candidatus Diapherotrites archaeon]|uniref:MaoC family dehydratase n=1 Tax=Candidatus Iainarchaeum sp. TaxID=3101447 RepID=A0A8T4L4C5_9ARCH|nr:MaoC family dehydratase [Candidatus Diapherotrites archaeon]
MKAASVEEKVFDEIQIGSHVSFPVTVNHQTVKEFAGLSGDYNPLHMDPTYAKETEFSQPICHGALINAFFSQLVGMHLPGKYCLYLSQESVFRKPVFLPSRLTIQGTVIAKSDSTRILTIQTQARNAKEEILVDGVAKVKVLR